MFDRLWRFLGGQVVENVPDELSACLECGAVQCVDSKWRNCPRRLERVSALKALHESEARDAGVTP